MGRHFKGIFILFITVFSTCAVRPVSERIAAIQESYEAKRDKGFYTQNGLEHDIAELKDLQKPGQAFFAAMAAQDLQPQMERSLRVVALTDEYKKVQPTVVERTSKSAQALEQFLKNSKRFFESLPSDDKTYKKSKEWKRLHKMHRDVIHALHATKLFIELKKSQNSDQAERVLTNCLSLGSFTDDRDELGNTLLHLAVKNRYFGAEIALLADNHSKNYTRANKTGVTPVDIEQEWKEKKARIPAAILQVAREKQEEQVKQAQQVVLAAAKKAKKKKKKKSLVRAQADSDSESETSSAGSSRAQSPVVQQTLQDVQKIKADLIEAVQSKNKTRVKRVLREIKKKHKNLNLNLIEMDAPRAEERCSLISCAVFNDVFDTFLKYRDGLNLDLDALDVDGLTPLGSAIMKGRNSLVRKLVSKRLVDVNKLNNMTFGMLRQLMDFSSSFGEAQSVHPFFYTMLFDNREGAKILAEAPDFDANIRSEGDTPLHMACQMGWADVAEILVRRGADVDAQQEDGKATSLQLALRKQSPETVAVLREAGADPNIPGKKGVTSGDFMLAAAQKPSEGVEKELIDELFKFKNLNPNLTNKDYGILYSLILCAHDLNLVKRFLQYPGTDVNLRNTDRRGFTPLYAAVQRNNVSVAALLIKSGAEVNSENSVGIRPLDFALSRSFENQEMIDLLRAHGAE